MKIFLEQFWSSRKILDESPRGYESFDQQGCTLRFDLLINNIYIFFFSVCFGAVPLLIGIKHVSAALTGDDTLISEKVTAHFIIVLFQKLHGQC